MKLRRGPVLCDGGDGSHAALTPWFWRGNVLCPNCLLRRISDAIRASELIEAEPVIVEETASKQSKGSRRKAVVVRLRRPDEGNQLELFVRRRFDRAKGEGKDDN